MKTLCAILLVLFGLFVGALAQSQDSSAFFHAALHVALTAAADMTDEAPAHTDTPPDAIAIFLAEYPDLSIDYGYLAWLRETEGDERALEWLTDQLTDRGPRPPAIHLTVTPVSN